MIIQLTPYGVFFLMAKLGATLGLGEISKVLVYFCTVAVALLLHGLLVYPLLLKAITGLSPFSFFKKTKIDSIEHSLLDLVVLSLPHTFFKN